MAVVTVRQLLDSGVHFGHQTRRWNPKMKRYILTDRSGIYIIDLQKSLNHIEKAYEFVKDTVAHGGSILFVGTKKQAQEAIAEQAQRVGMPRLEKYSLGKSLGGIRNVNKTPSAIWVVDTNKEHLAITEAKKLGIPVIGILDTNCDPDEVTIGIPGNDDAIRSVALLTRVIADAVAEGTIARHTRTDEAAEPLAEWERELLEASAAAETAAEAADAAEAPAAEQEAK